LCSPIWFLGVCPRDRQLTSAALRGKTFPVAARYTGGQAETQQLKKASRPNKGRGRKTKGKAASPPCDPCGATWHPASGIRHPASGIWHLATGI